MPFSVLISEIASAPPRSAPAGDRRGVGDVRRQLHDQRLLGPRAQRSRSASVSLGFSPTISPECTFGQETFSSIAATSWRAATRSTQRAKSSRVVAMIETINGTGSSASRGRSSARKPSRPLLGRPIELSIPPGVSQIRRGALPARGSGVIVFETKAAKGKSLKQRVAEDLAGGDRVVGPGGVDAPGGPARSRRAQAYAWLTSSIPVAAQDRAVDAEPQEAAARASAPRSRSRRRSRRPSATRAPARPATPCSAQSARTASSIAGGPQE